MSYIYWHTRPEVIAKDKRKAKYLHTLGIRVLHLKERAINKDCMLAVKKLLQKKGILCG